MTSKQNNQSAQKSGTTGASQIKAAPPVKASAATPSITTVTSPANSSSASGNTAAKKNVAAQPVQNTQNSAAVPAAADATKQTRERVASWPAEKIMQTAHEMGLIKPEIKALFVANGAIFTKELSDGSKKEIYDHLIAMQNLLLASIVQMGLKGLAAEISAARSGKTEDKTDHLAAFYATPIRIGGKDQPAGEVVNNIQTIVDTLNSALDAYNKQNGSKLGEISLKTPTRRGGRSEGSANAKRSYLRIVDLVLHTEGDKVVTFGDMVQNEQITALYFKANDLTIPLATAVVKEKDQNGKEISRRTLIIPKTPQACANLMIKGRTARQIAQELRAGDHAEIGTLRALVKASCDEQGKDNVPSVWASLEPIILPAFIKQRVTGRPEGRVMLGDLYDVYTKDAEADVAAGNDSDDDDE